MNVYLKAQRSLAQQLDHEPTVDEIARHLDKPVKTVSKMLKLNETVSSVDVAVGKDYDKPLLETISEEESRSPAEILQDNFIQNNVAHWVYQLAEKQRDVICRRYGLCGFESATLEQVAWELGVTRERVRQIQMDGLKRLKEILESSGYSFESIFN